MSKRLPASMRTRQWLSDVIEGRPSSPAGREELVKLATRLIIEETLEAEARDAVGRDYYEHGAEPGSGYRRYHDVPNGGGRRIWRETWNRSRWRTQIAWGR